MSWQGQMGTIVRHLIDDVDESSYKFSDERIETLISVSAQLLIMNVDFTNTYTVNVEQSSISPDPTDSRTLDNAFISLCCLKAACLIVGGQVRTESGKSFSIKDGPSAIDLGGISESLMKLYKHLCDSYDQTLLEYRAGSSNVGQAILGPYSPGSYLISRNSLDHRSAGF